MKHNSVGPAHLEVRAGPCVIDFTILQATSQPTVRLKQTITNLTGQPTVPLKLKQTATNLTGQPMVYVHAVSDTGQRAVHELLSDQF